MTLTQKTQLALIPLLLAGFTAAVLALGNMRPATHPSDAVAASFLECVHATGQDSFRSR